jgi:predicted nuclease of predicted toxin-antitoxin system
MRLLFDQNISRRLVTALVDAYPGSSHVADLGLERATDEAVWRYAGAQGYLLVSKDADFRQLSLLYGFPPKVVWIRLGNCSTADIERLLRSRAARVAEFAADPEAAILGLA